MKLATLLCLLVMAGCQTVPADPTPPPEEPAKAAACAPLPMCNIPSSASSTQLEEALWQCVVEYRALYSVCYDMQHQEPKQ